VDRSGQREIVTATAAALILGILVSWGTIYGLNRYLDRAPTPTKQPAAYGFCLSPTEFRGRATPPDGSAATWADVIATDRGAAFISAAASSMPVRPPRRARSMIKHALGPRPMGGYRFSEKIMLNKKIERDDDSEKSHPALGDLHDLLAEAVTLRNSECH